MKIERQLQGNLNTVLTELIKEKELENKLQPYVTNEENRADITIKNRSGKAIFFIELKDPTAKNGRSVFDSDTLLRELGRAQKSEIQYFGICNFIACAFFDSKNINEKVSVSESFFTTQEIVRLSRNYVVSKEIEKKLKTIAEFYIERALEIIERKSVTFAQPDELYIFKVRKLIEAYSNDVTDKVWEKYNSDKKFEKRIHAYSQSQLWNSPKTFDEIENLTHIALLMLISKLIFYKAYVDNQTWHNLSPMKVGKDIETSEQLEDLIWQYFTEFKEVTGDFELLIGERSDIIFQIPFVSDAVVELVNDVLDTDKHYDFSKIPYDIIGRIFEELIREDERHKLGQYFTPPHVIDLIIAFAINSENDKIFDPSCGSGTFLVRAYERKRLLSQDQNGGAKRHEKLLNEIYGNDLSGYPAYLSMLNLSIRNTRHKSYPRIINKDFFAFTNSTKLPIHNQEGLIENKTLPKFNAIIGNPPYTRQEDIGAMHGTIKKSSIRYTIQRDFGFDPNQRTGIYAYFFYHATSFLKEKGYLAYIVQNSWLETDYGADLQQFFLNRFEIITIIDSEVERFFPTASVNTTIVILRKQSDENIRENTLVKFVYLKDTLSNILKHSGNADKLRLLIENTVINIADNYLSINCVNQSILKKFSKWGAFFKAPQVYFDIFEKGKDLFVPLKTIAEVKFGIKTGCNDFFILEDKTEFIENEKLNAIVNNDKSLKSTQVVKKENLKIVLNGFNELWFIEDELLKPLITSPKDLSVYDCTNLKLRYLLFFVSDEINEIKDLYPYAYNYIKSAEKKNIHSASSLAARKIWYDVGEKSLPNLSFSYMINDFGKTFLGKAFTNDNLHNIFPKRQTVTLFYFLNSTISWLFQQLIIRTNFGDGLGKIQSNELAEFLIPDIDLENLKIDLGETKNYKEEFGLLTSLTTVNPERLKLDSAILEAIGFENIKERNLILLELYKATYQLIDARLQKAKSLMKVKGQSDKVEFSVYIEQLKQLIEEEKLKPRNSLTFAKEIKNLVTQITSVISLQKKILSTYWKEMYKEEFNEKSIAEKAQKKLF